MLVVSRMGTTKPNRGRPVQKKPVCQVLFECEDGGIPNEGHKTMILWIPLLLKSVQQVGRHGESAKQKPVWLHHTVVAMSEYKGCSKLILHQESRPNVRLIGMGRKK